MKRGDKLRNMSNKEIAKLFPDYHCNICEELFGGENFDCPKFVYKCDDCCSGREKFLDQDCCKTEN